MNSAEILAQVAKVAGVVLDNDRLHFDRNTQASDVPEWDSLSHIELVVAVEKHFRIKFTAREVQAFRNVGEMCDAIERRLA